jgi:hypothetical protein
MLDDRTRNPLPVNGKIYEVRSIETWTRDIEDESRGKSGQFRILPREIFSSRAYLTLTLAQAHVLECYLNKLRYETGNTKGSKRRGKNSSGYPINKDNLIVTNNELFARQKHKSERTIANARKRLVEIGFLDVIISAKFPKPGVYALSDRYKQYPDGNYLPKNERPVSFAPYQNIQKYNARRRPK